MFNLIPVSLLIAAVGGIIYIISGHLSEFDKKDREENEDYKFNLKTLVVQYINQLPLDNIKSQSLVITQKLLHRFRLALLKTDNHLMRLIGKISQRDKVLNENDKNNGDNSDIPSDFWKNFTDSSDNIATKKDESEKHIVAPAIEPEIKINFAVKNEAVKKFFDIKPAKKTLKTKKSSKK